MSFTTSVVIPQQLGLVTPLQFLAQSVPIELFALGITARYPFCTAFTTQLEKHFLLGSDLEHSIVSMLKVSWKKQNECVPSDWNGTHDLLVKRHMLYWWPSTTNPGCSPYLDDKQRPLRGPDVTSCF